MMKFKKLKMIVKNILMKNKKKGEKNMSSTATLRKEVPQIHQTMIFLIHENKLYAAEPCQSLDVSQSKV